MRYTIDESLVTWDGLWHHIFIPLSDFTEHGAWDNGWFNPVGLYDWSAVDKFEIVAEHYDLNGNIFWFDNIYVNDLDTAAVWDTTAVEAPEGVQDFFTENLLFNVFPNPTRNFVIICYSLPAEADIEIGIYDFSGRKILILGKTKQSAGDYLIHWNCRDSKGNKLRPGLYFCRIFAKEGYSINRKLIIH